MATVFEHYFKEALRKAVTTLKAKCQEAKDSEDQKAFNIDTQIPKMGKVLTDIETITISATEPDWPAFRAAMLKVIDEAKESCAKEKEAKQAKCGTSIKTTFFDEFGNKLLAMFDECRADIEKPTFSPHDRNPASQYTSIDYSTSEFLNQLIHIALKYRFDKVQEKHVADGNFSSKHQKKWDKLTRAINAWTKSQKTSSFTLEEYKDIIDGMLTNLIATEAKIQNEAGSSLMGQARSWGMWAASKLTEEQDDLRVTLPKLQERFNKDCSALPFQAPQEAASMSL